MNIYKVNTPPIWQTVYKPATKTTVTHNRLDKRVTGDRESKREGIRLQGRGPETDAEFRIQDAGYRNTGLGTWIKYQGELC